MGWHDEEDDLRKVRIVGPSRRPNMKRMALAASISPHISTMNPNSPEKSEERRFTIIPISHKTNFSGEEREKLTKLHGKAKKAYVNELKEKYDRTI